MKRVLICILVFSILLLIACTSEELKVEKEDYSDRDWSLDHVCIPDAETAVKVAEVYLTAVFGEKMVNEQKSLNVNLDEKSGIWLVTGTVSAGGDIVVTGGDIEIALNMNDGQVLEIGLGE